ncbi:Gfo/Idh/MocA family oxidoreductase [Phototrophicus methaneseepsis]|uniref:Gfo/Idh/MocA family oxidoreductase n=1 Tax=Phototrophicus methaneseepsis TaxID=2710758 RepID=A0A7S8EBR9_9CHLR|nr:Gfo/Idh/MocA family oxidoreductase [Phototrophicus methaneseepsis]QPC84065.1 Gfo/Idh/MocA family oxidoreductase [Phototrophicus methaneseepsis]
MPPIETVIIGAGGRGSVYGQYALKHPQDMIVTAVAEPQEDRRMRMATEHDIAPDHLYSDWEGLLANGKKIAPTAINATMDRTHMESTIALLNAGYDVLLEKPMSPVLEENVRLVQVAEDQGRLLQICHVLRFAPFWQTIRKIVQSGRLGRIISVDHRENLIYWHMAHSYVRGNWREEATSGPMILAKCCHDLDILHWILQKDVVYLSSYGSLTYFRPENAPEGATLRCTDGCPVADTCKYYAPRRYASAENAWPYNALTLTPTVEARMEALRTGPYGRCVWHCDNDVVDHQTINMELEDGTTVTMTMQGQGDEECRTMRYDGTKATLYAKFAYGNDKITIRDHLTGEEEQVTFTVGEGGHGGGDMGIVQSFVNALRGEPDESITTARESLESHLLAFAAEESRLNHTTIHMPTFRARVEAEARAKYQG